MTRPPVSVVMPFTGDPEAARAAIAALLALHTRPGDELILADNSATAPEADGVQLVRALGERSPAHARNAGARRAARDWILFLDADCRAPHHLLDAYFAAPIEGGVGALAGEIVPAGGGDSLATRYAASRNFLSQAAHLAHPYRPRAAAANLLVRREAFDRLGGFCEGLRAAEDTDFCWRLQAAGWRLELAPQAIVEHRYRATISGLRRQWREYAAGRAWLARRYPGFRPQPALVRALRRIARGRPRLPAAAVSAPAGATPGAPTPARGRPDRARFFALDVLLALDELVGFTLGNRPRPLLAAAQRTLAERATAAARRLVTLAGRP